MTTTTTTSTSTITISFLLLLLVLVLLQQPFSVVSEKSYVVYLGRHSQQESGRNPVLTADQMSHSYFQLLGSCMSSEEKAKEVIFYSYSSHINGFAAMLEDHEVEILSGHNGVVAVLPNKEHYLHTTRTWGFMGLEDSNGVVSDDSIWKHANFGQDVIIGNLDTGVWPESLSFNCTVSEAIPSRWKGKCDSNNGFKCNSKLIGARYFNKGFSADSARDTDGHGTHTLSTAAGCLVPGANLLGSANGTAKGGSPKAWVATYKVCWPSCYEADILAAFDTAIQDGVDVLSLSLGSYLPQEYSVDSIAIGSFHAARNGISVVCSAGNSGPLASSVTNVSPWVMTIGASTVDRQFQSNVTLGNGHQFKGLSYNSNTLPAGKFYPLIISTDAKSSDADVNDAKYCYSGTLEPAMVKGKIVVCIRSSSDIEKGQVVSEAGGVGVVLVNSFSGAPSPQAHFLPASVVSKEDGDSIASYISGTQSPEAYISGGTVIGEAVAPSMASFSSSGPNRLTPEILKPDVTAPGVNILAAYSEATGPTGDSDSRHLPFNIISGTSMSCPHVTGIVGLVKSIHPDWSPAAIKSAIMTTAVTRNNKGEPILTASGAKANPFNYGAGHVVPNKAMDPGLVYDLNLTDYLNFLCYIGYDDKQLALFYDKSYQCPSKSTTNVTLSNINYPSITVPQLSGPTTVTRTLKNVGTPGTYMVTVDAPSGVSVKVEPKSLEFKAVGEEKRFEITLELMVDLGSGYLFGGLTWSDGLHDVRSPIVVKKAENALLLAV
ncbi:Subtilisin-like protease SBT5.4 [Linum perenne]